MTDIKVLVFDLDDTLINTTRDLIPQAMLEAWEKMRNVGLLIDYPTLIQKREKILRDKPRNFSFEALVSGENIREGVDLQTVARAGRDAFYTRKIPSGLRLDADILSLLEKFRNKYPLFLVTAGDPTTQSQKIDLCGLRPFFKEVYCVDPFKGESKFQAYKNIQLRLSEVSACDFLAIGNRVDTDLAPAKELGWSTFWLCIGEYQYLKPQFELEKPDFQGESLQALLKVCPL